jgi:hypothetical protein
MLSAIRIRQTKPRGRDHKLACYDDLYLFVRTLLDSRFSPLDQEKCWRDLGPPSTLFGMIERLRREYQSGMQELLV